MTSAHGARGRVHRPHAAARLGARSSSRATATGACSSGTATSPSPCSGSRCPRACRSRARPSRPRGTFLALCGDYVVLVLELINTALGARPAQQPRPVAQGYGHSNEVVALQWSPDERQIVSVGKDCCVCVWNFVPACDAPPTARTSSRARALCCARARAAETARGEARAFRGAGEGGRAGPTANEGGGQSPGGGRGCALQAARDNPLHAAPAGGHPVLQLTVRRAQGGRLLYYM